MTGTQALFDANMAVMERHFPQIFARLKAVKSPKSSVIVDQGLAVDIDLGNGRLYDTNAVDFSTAQVEAFVASPAQVGYFLPDIHLLDSLISRRMHQDLLDCLARNGANDLPLRTNADTGYLFVLGVGLGHHLPLLLDKLRAPHVVICEVFDEFLLASLRVIDWGNLVAQCEQRGATINLVLGANPAELMTLIDAVMEVRGHVLLDGSYIYQHYGLWVFEETKRRLVNELPRLMVARGYFEDERKMMRNAVTNLHKHDVHILPAAFRPRTHTPVFIVGAGPSLDEAIPYIQEWREYAVVFSAGSGLQPCLKNGIIPDFHVELENTYNILTKLRFIMDQHPDLFPNGKFEGIKLIGSATLNPTVLDLFDDIFLFFRDSVTPTLTLGMPYGTHSGVAPTVANTSLGVVARMGLGDVYLFGTDCGWRDDTSHHSRDTIYYTADTFKAEKMSGTYTMPGNFGGIVHSDLVFDWCRDMLEQVIASYSMDVFNCSDGALIQGATPRVAESLHFQGEPLDRTAILAEIAADRPFFAKGTFFRDVDMTVFQGQLDTYEKALMTLVDTAIAENWTFRRFHDEFWRDLGGEATYRNMGMASWVQCASIGMLKHSCVFLNRIPDSETRDAVTVEFFRMFRAAHEEMFAEIRHFLTEAMTWIGGGPEPEWTDGIPRFPGTSY